MNCRRLGQVIEEEQVGSRLPSPPIPSRSAERLTPILELLAQVDPALPPCPQHAGGQQQWPQRQPLHLAELGVSMPILGEPLA